MTRTAILVALALTMGACSSATAPVPFTPPSNPPARPASPSNVAGWWVGTANYGTILDATCPTGDTVHIKFTQAGHVLGGLRWVTTCQGRTGDWSHPVLRDSIAFIDSTDVYGLQFTGGKFAGVVSPTGDMIAGTILMQYFSQSYAVAVTLVRAGADTVWPQPAPALVTIAGGAWLSDSLPTGCPEGTAAQIKLAIAVGAGGLYQASEYDRQCVAPDWPSAILIAVDTGRVGPDSVLALSQYSFPPGPITTASGSNWRLKMVTPDSLVDVTPDSVNHSWLPAAFVLSAPGSPGAARRASRRR
jgi:hypothetical protein